MYNSDRKLILLFLSGGWYCIEGAVQPKPTVNTQGGKCKQRYYCPEGSDGPTICGEGVYCQQERLDSPSGNCDAGKCIICIYYLLINKILQILMK